MMLAGFVIPARDGGQTGVASPLVNIDVLAINLGKERLN